MTSRPGKQYITQERQLGQQLSRTPWKIAGKGILRVLTSDPQSDTLQAECWQTMQTVHGLIASKSAGRVYAIWRMALYSSFITRELHRYKVGPRARSARLAFQEAADIRGQIMPYPFFSLHIFSSITSASARREKIFSSFARYQYMRYNVAFANYRQFYGNAVSEWGREIYSSSTTSSDLLRCYLLLLLLCTFRTKSSCFKLRMNWGNAWRILHLLIIIHAKLINLEVVKIGSITQLAETSGGVINFCACSITGKMCKSCLGVSNMMIVCNLRL